MVADRYAVIDRRGVEQGRFAKLIQAYDRADWCLARGMGKVGIKDLQTGAWEIVLEYLPDTHPERFRDDATKR